MKKTDKLKKLKLDVQTIKPLTPDQLTAVAAGLWPTVKTPTETCPPCR